jgi:coenzyme F420 biosynthesis associated uncharacterized protein
MNEARHERSSVDWELAAATARRALSWKLPLADDVRLSVEADFVELTRRAEDLVAEVTGLELVSGNARARTVDRAEWVDANLASFSRLLAPVLDRQPTSSIARAMQRTPIGRQAAGVEVGLLLSWMSTRVLGQYDAVPGAPEGKDAIYYVAPNIVGIEQRHGFAPRDFRLWIAVHEVTHRFQFTAVEWMEPYFLGLVERATSISFDVSTVLESLGRLVAAARAGENPLGETGIIGLLASTDQLVTVRDAQALMSLLEGHADIVMGSVGDDVIPGATRFAKVLSERRERAKGGTKLIQQLLGVEAKLRQYRDGERFVEAVIAERGVSGFSQIWQSSEYLPTLEEIHSPERWLARVGGSVSPTA